MRSFTYYCASHLRGRPRQILSRWLPGSVRTALRRLLFGRAEATVIQAGPLAGCKIHAPLDERLAFGLGYYEPFVMAELAGRLQTGSTFYDIGAHIGFFSLLAARRGARVFAFEANPANLTLLNRNIGTNALDGSVASVARAVADHDGRLEFATFGFSLVGGIADGDTPADATRIEVPCVSLDTWVFGLGNPPPTLIKIDVEGAEACVLRGAERVLAVHRPALLVEIHHRKRWDAVLDITRPLGYAWRRLDKTEVLLGEDEVGQFVGTPAEIVGAERP